MKEGKVLYERIIQLQFRGNVLPDMSNTPKERKDKFQLSFANNQSIWEAVPDMEDHNEEREGQGGELRVMRFGGGDELTYCDFQTGKKIKEQELSTRNYIVEDSIEKLNWKLTDETKTILGHTVQKAIAERHIIRSMMTMENGEMKRQQVPDTSFVTAWFATDIPVPAGPEFQGQLPGLILELDMNNGRITYTALELSSKVNASTIKEPKGGKRISAAEFNKEREKEFEEMRKNMPAGRRIQIVRQ
jgi:GLPGLI family protein